MGDDPTADLSLEIQQVAARLRKGIATGASHDDSVTLRLDGSGKVSDAQIDAEAYGLTEEDAARLSKAVAEAAEAAFRKRARKARRELKPFASVS